MIPMLIKGEKTTLDFRLKKVAIGFGWDAPSASGHEFDLRLCAFLFPNERWRPDDQEEPERDCVFFNRPSSRDGAVLYKRGDDCSDVERVVLDLSALWDFERVVFVAAIVKGKERDQHFGMVRNAYIRAFDPATTAELARFELGAAAPPNQTLVLAELYPFGNEWYFHALGQGYDFEIGEIARRYGVANLSADLFNVTRDAER